MKTKDITEVLRTKVNWQAFTWAFGVVLIVMGWLIISSGRIETKIDTVNENYTNIKTNIEVLKTDVSWLKDEKKNEEQAYIYNKN